MKLQIEFADIDKFGRIIILVVEASLYFNDCQRVRGNTGYLLDYQFSIKVSKFV